MQKNDLITCEIIAYGCSGEGIAKPDGFTLFVPFAAVGDICRIRILKVLKNYGYGKIHEIITPSLHRIIPPCPVFGKCGGCALMHVDYKTQLAWKRERVQDALCRIGGQTNIAIAETAYNGITMRYRNKIQMPVAAGKDGIIAGFYAPNSHRVISTDNCLLQSSRCALAIRAVLAWMHKYKIAPYDEERHTGIVRHIYVRESTTQQMVSLVTNGSRLPHAEDLISAMQAIGVTTLLQNINTKRTNVILGRETKLLYGSGVIEETLDTIRYKVSHHSFFQVNPPMATALYKKGLSLLGDISDKTVFDLYCGIGAISLFLARHARHVIGVDIVPEAIADAKENAALNGIKNASFYAGDAGAVTKELYAKGVVADIAVVDPPRKGCDAALIETLLAMAPQKILYISCNPATLARDIQLLSKEGYSCNKAYPFDLFPQTAHVESVVLMSRKDK
ncbi:MAG: 23S rRNA (uracil(1939)-C(5))-methyltransferase RlmD [Clostridia bacterium]|nr:23S rRNA (uracil(1939)-C(5))-methyltransferase RlmD [Clostridia bacterium]